METSSWRQRKMNSATETVNPSSRRIKGKARMVPPGSGDKPEKARKSLNEKLSTVVLDSRTEVRRVNVCGDEDLGNKIETSREFSPSGDASDELLKKLESLVKDHGRTVSDMNDDDSSESKNERTLRGNCLTEMKWRVEGLAGENHKLRNSLAAKEKLVRTLNDQKSMLESEFEVLRGRLDSAEKENVFLRYEFRVLEKDLEVRTEEMEYAQRSIDSAHKQQLKSVNKIVELEAECQRLRLLIRKKFSGGATMLLQTKFTSDAEEQRMEARRRNTDIQNGFAKRDDFHTRNLQHDLLMEQIDNIREENKNLKEIILKKGREVKSLSPRQNQSLSRVGNLDAGSEDGISSSESFPKALVSKPNSRGRRADGSSEINVYMKDFAEMEKFAIVSADKNSRDDEDDRPFDWIQAILSTISKQQRISKRGVKELLEDIKIALGCMDVSKDNKKHEAESTPLCIGWKSPESGSMTKEEIKRHLGLSTPNLTADDESLVGEKDSVQIESVKRDLREENENLKDEIKKIDLESKELRLKLEESEEKIRKLETEMKTLNESKETEKSINEELDTHLSFTRAKLNETEKKLSSLEIELDNRKSFYEELEGTCLELQLQLESVQRNDPAGNPREKSRKRLQNGRDTASASVKLAECQGTILNLRKQLKALALSSNLGGLPSETSSIAKFPDKGSSLRDQMLFNTAPHDDDDDDGDGDDGMNGNALIVYTPRVYSITKDEEKKDGITAMGMVKSRKKHGFGFLKKLLYRRRKRGTSKKCLALTM